jgi:predicted SAM-dependent methyltransferase
LVVPDTRRLVFAADAVIRCSGGRLVLHTTSGTLPAYECMQPMLVGWLCQFARPLSPATAIAALPAADRDAVAEVVDYLLRSGVLVPADEPAATEPGTTAAARGTQQHLRALARAAYDLSCDVLAAGPELEATLATRTGLGLERRLVALLGAVESLQRLSLDAAAGRIAAQLDALGVDPSTRELKLHIGCGRAPIEGWINIDIDPAPLALNVLRGLPFGDGAARYIFVSHLLEHLFFPRDVQAFLTELRRVLAPGGVVRIVVPDIEQCIEAYAKRDPVFFASRRETWPWWPENPTRLEDFLAYAGAGPEPAYLFESHKYGYDFETLAKVLAAAGFEDIERSTFMHSAHAELRVDGASAVAGARYGDRYYSLFVEAESPKR